MNAVSTMNNLKEVLEALPQKYEPVDETFLEVYADQIAALKNLFADKGGVYMISVGEYDMICRLPQTEHLKAANKDSDKKDGLDVDRELFSYCLLYPSIYQVNDWVKEGKPGIISSAVRKLMELGLVHTKAREKKL